MSRGPLLSVTVDNVSSALAADAVAGATVLLVGNAAVFDEKGGQFISVDSQDPAAYVSADADAGTVTLAAPGLAADADTDASVVLYATEKRKAEIRTAHIDSDLDADEDLEAVIDGGVASNYPEGELMAGVIVEYQHDETYGYRVTKVPEQEPRVEASYIERPFIIAVLLSPVTITTGLAYQTVTGWTVVQSQGEDETIAYDPADGRFRVSKPGYYSVTSSAVMWEDDSATGRRAIRPYYTTLIGSFAGGENVQDATTRRVTTAVFTPTKNLVAGEFIEIQVSQNSGGDVDLVGDSDGNSSFVCIEYRGPLRG